MTEPTITCPNCKTEIRLTESLAAPLIAATRQQFERQLAQNDEDIARREQGIRDEEKQIAEACMATCRGLRGSRCRRSKGWICLP